MEGVWAAFGCEFVGLWENEVASARAPGVMLYVLGIVSDSKANASPEPQRSAVQTPVASWKPTPTKPRLSSPRGTTTLVPIAPHNESVL